MKKIIATVCLLATAILASGCNTIQGFGKDVERAGEKVQSIGK